MVVRGRTRITRKGQITVPARIRHALDLEEGDHLDVSLQDDGSIRVERHRSVVESLAGSLWRPGQPQAPDDAAEERRAYTELMGADLARRHEVDLSE